MKLKRRIDWTLLTLGTVGVLAVTLAVGYFTWSGFRTERQMFVESVMAESLAWIMPALEKWETSHVRDSMVRAASAEGIWAMRLVDTRGMAAMSTRGETGAKEGDVRLFTEALSGAASVMHGRTAGGWVVYSRLVNGKECRSCHQEDGEILGALAVELEGRSMPSAIRSASVHMGITTWLIVVVLCFLLALTSRSLAGKSVEEMGAVEASFADNQEILAVELPIGSSEESRSLTQALDNYLTSLRRRVQESREHASVGLTRSVAAASMITQSLENLGGIETSLAEVVAGEDPAERVGASLRDQLREMEETHGALERAVHCAKQALDLAKGFLQREEGLDELLGQWSSFLKKMGSQADLHGEAVGRLIRYTTSMVDMADQGRLLGFQAAVQGYGASSQTKGLTVVAESVERIAEETAASSKDAKDLAEELDQGLRDMERELARKGQEIEIWLGQGGERKQEAQEAIEAFEESLKGLEKGRDRMGQLVAIWPNLIEAVKESREAERGRMEKLKSVRRERNRLEEGLGEVAVSLKQCLSEYKLASDQLREMMGKHGEENVEPKGTDEGEL